MLTVRIEAIDCRQVRSYRKELTLRMHLLDNGQEVLAVDTTEPLGDSLPRKTQDLASLRDRLRERMQDAIEQYKARRDFLQTPEVSQLVTDLQGSLIL